MIKILINKIDGDHEIVLKFFISRFSFFLQNMITRMISKLIYIFKDKF